MKIDTNTKIRSLLQEIPALEDILSWYDITLARPEMDMTLERLCKEYEVDLEDILTDIELSLEDDDDNDDDDDDDDDDEDDEN